MRIPLIEEKKETDLNKVNGKRACFWPLFSFYVVALVSLGDAEPQRKIHERAPLFFWTCAVAHGTSIASRRLDPSFERSSLPNGKRRGEPA